MPSSTTSSIPIPNRKPSVSAVDASSLSPEDARLLRLYGRAPSQSQHFARHLKDRKYFDSGDYALSKAGHGDRLDVGAVGSLHPLPGSIPHPGSPLGSLIGGDGNIIGPAAGTGRRKSSLSMESVAASGFVASGKGKC